MTADPIALAPESVVVPPLPVSKPAPRFGAAKAFAAFVIMLAAQAAAGAAVMFQAVLVALARGQDPADPAFADRVLSQATGPMLIAAGVFSTIAAWLVARMWAWDAVFDRSAAGIGLVKVPARQIAIWSGVGAVAAFAYLAAVAWLVPFDPSTPLGPLAKAAAAGGPIRVVWIALALLFAPLVEEFFYRGLLLRGFTASWGATAATITVTVLFVLVHLGETYNYWPATAAITLMAVCTIAARRTTGSLVPAVVLHFTYNLVIAVGAFTVLSW